jgi:hypothetical protein
VGGRAGNAQGGEPRLPLKRGASGARAEGGRPRSNGAAVVLPLVVGCGVHTHQTALKEKKRKSAAAPASLPITPSAQRPGLGLAQQPQEAGGAAGKATPTPKTKIRALPVARGCCYCIGITSERAHYIAYPGYWLLGAGATCAMRTRVASTDRLVGVMLLAWFRWVRFR